MPVSRNGITLFSTAAAECVVLGGNIAPGIHRSATHPGMRTITPASQGGVDTDIQAHLVTAKGAMCHGVTMAWIISFLCAPGGGASSTGAFAQLFNDVLRFQGAYFQSNARSKGMKSDMYSNPKRLFEEYAEAGLATGIKFLSGRITMVLRAEDLPSAPTWAAHYAFPNHAIGIGFTGGCYYIMDPNFGLFMFQSAVNFRIELQKMYVLYVVKKGKTDPISAIFYST